MASQNSLAAMKAAAAVLFILTAACAVFFLKEKPVTAVKPGEETLTVSEKTFSPTSLKLTYGYDSAASFYANRSSAFYFCTKDGVKYIDGTGKSLWEDVFTMTAPIMLGEGDCVIVGEPKGNAVYVYGLRGRLYTAQFDGKLVSMGMNSSGSAAVTFKTEQSYQTMVYDPVGNVLIEYIHDDKHVFPMCADVSEDGRIAAISLLDINGVDVESHIVFIYLDKNESKNFADGIFASVPVPGEMVASLSFDANGGVLSLSDKALRFQSAAQGSAVSDVTVVSLSNQAAFSGTFAKGGFVVAYGAPMTGQDGDEPGKIAFYDSAGKALAEQRLGADITFLRCSGDVAVAGANRAFYAFDKTGKKLWEYHASQDFKQLMPLENIDTALFATTTDAVVMARKN